MSINLPHWLAEVVNLLGFGWPEIDEDQLHDAARELGPYAQQCEDSHNTTHRVVTSDLPQVYAAQSYTALAEMWAGQTAGHMKTLITVCRDLAEALDIAAHGVTLMKDACLPVGPADRRPERRRRLPTALPRPVRRPRNRLAPQPLPPLRPRNRPLHRPRPPRPLPGPQPGRLRPQPHGLDRPAGTEVQAEPARLGQMGAQGRHLGRQRHLRTARRARPSHPGDGTYHVVHARSGHRSAHRSRERARLGE